MSDQIIPIAVYTADPTAAPITGEYFDSLKADPNGALWIRPIATLGAGVGVQTSRNPDTDTIASATIVAFDVASFMYGYSGLNWDRVRTTSDHADAIAPIIEGVLRVASHGKCINSFGNWDRNRSDSIANDNLAAWGNGVPITNAVLRGYNSITYDRITVTDETTDVVLPTAVGTLSIANRNLMLAEIDGSTDRFERERANSTFSLMASAARTATASSPDQNNYNWCGAHIIINVTSITATPSVVPTIQGKDPISGTYYTLLTGLAITTTGITILKIYPGITALANGSANDILPRYWRITMTHADADSITYSVAAMLMR